MYRFMNTKWIFETWIKKVEQEKYEKQTSIELERGLGVRMQSSASTHVSLFLMKDWVYDIYSPLKILTGMLINILGIREYNEDWKLNEWYKRNGWISMH